MSNSPLVVYTKISPFKSAPRNKTITKITPHHVGGNLTVESIGQVFQTPKRNASSNYSIGSDGRIGMYVEEKDRSWCSSSLANDNAALTIEVANDSGSPNWTVSSAAWEVLVRLCVDMCRRNHGIKQKNGRPGIYCDDTPNASLTFHRYFSATGCAQPYIWNRRQQLCDEVNKRLNIKINTEDDDMNIDRFEELWLEMRKKLKDNDSNAYSNDARTWAITNGLIAGGGTAEDGNPNYMWEDLLTREQFVTILHRFAHFIGKV